MNRIRCLVCMLLLGGLSAGFFLGTDRQARGADFFVTSTADTDGVLAANGSGTLRQAINGANAAGAGPHNITFQTSGTVTLTNVLPMIQSSVSIQGTGQTVTVSGANQFRVFFVQTGTVTIKDMSIANGKASGGAGGAGGGGGGLGAGGGVFVNQGANVTLENITFTNNQVQGGKGGVESTNSAANFHSGGGGGGLGRDGGNGSSADTGAISDGGAGGLNGSDGANATAGSNAGGGGGGLGGQGGNGSAGNISAGGGGGAGLTPPAGAPGGGGTAGLAAGPVDGGNGAANAGGGGGANSAATGGNGGKGGFGGGGGGAGSGNTASGKGGDGGDFGGGGGGAGGGGPSGNGGVGGYGAGGGGAGSADPDGVTNPGTGGAAGFGGGAGGVAAATGGGGGSGLGGAVFVRDGGLLTLKNVTSTGSNFTAGTGADGGANGTTQGKGIFLHNNVAVFELAPAQTATYAEEIGGDGGIKVQGGGNLTLSGTSTYTGTTTVDAGTLNITGTIVSATTVNAANLTVPGTLNNTLTVNNGGTADIGGQVTGAVIVNGTLTVPGLISNTLTVNNGGTATVDGQVTGNVAVNAGAFLQGIGQLGNTTVSGRIGPGTNSIGAMTVNGTYTQNKGSTYQVDVNPAGQADRINATGAATINGGTVQVNGAAGSYTFGTRYTIVRAGSVTGVYDSVTDNLQFFDFVPVYSGTEVQLAVIGGTSTIAQTFNQQAVAGALDQLVATATGDMAQILRQIAFLPPDQARAALDQLSGEMYGSLLTLSVERGSMMLRVLGNRLRGGPVVVPASFAAPEVLPSVTDIQQASFRSHPASPRTTGAHGCSSKGAGPWVPWARGYSQFGDISGDGNAQGFSYDYMGGLLGFDFLPDEQTVLGFFGGHTYSNFLGDGAAGNAALNSTSAGLYAWRLFPHFYLLGISAYDYNNYDTTRTIAFANINRTANGNGSGSEFDLYAEIGAPLWLRKVLLQPFLGLQYINLRVNNFGETGADALNLNVNGLAESLRGVAGARLAYAWQMGNWFFAPDVHGRWMYEFNEQERFTTAAFAGGPGAAFVTRGVDLGHHFFIFGGGGTLTWGPRLSLYASYDAQFAQRQMSHTGAGGVEVRW